MIDDATTAALLDVVRLIVRRKLRVSLSVGDGSAQNQEALDLCASIHLEALAAASAQPIQDMRAFAATLAYRACADHFRAKRPERTSLAHQVRYFLSHHADFALWEASGDMVAGRADWRGRAPSSGGSPQLEGLEAPRRPRAWMQAADWARLFHALFEHTGGPVALDDLIAGLVTLLDVREAVQEPLDDVSPAAAGTLASETAVLREMLAALWAEVLALRQRQRAAYLLNFREGDLDVFPENGVASIPEVTGAVELNDARLERICRETPGPPAALGCTALWPRLPLEDSVIAPVLDATRQQVINLRKVARERILQRLREQGKGLS